METEPIYCAEQARLEEGTGFSCVSYRFLSVSQIVVPVDLADVLKAFTKEIIRRQPENIVEFAAK